MSEHRGWDVIITDAASTAVDLDDQNLTDWRMCWASNGTTDDRAKHACAEAPAPSLTGEPISGFMSACIFNLDSDVGVTSADVLDLSDDLLVCIVIGEGGGLLLAVLVFGIWPDVVDAIEFRRRWALFAPWDLEPADCDIVLLRLLLVNYTHTWSRNANTWFSNEYVLTIKCTKL